MDNNSNIQQPAQPVQQRPAQQPQNNLDIKELFFMCLSNWKWFVLSLVCCVGLACFYILRTPAVYTRNASIMMKDDKKSKSISSDISEAFSTMGITNTGFNVINEIAALKSPASVADVVRRMDLNVGYKTKGTFHDVTLYGITNPVKVNFLDTPENTGASFTLTLKEGDQFSISKIKMLDNEFTQVIPGAVGDTLTTPFGRISVEKSASVAEWTGDIMVTHSSVNGAARSCSSRLDVSLADKLGSIVNISYKDVSIQRADDFINTLIAVYNEKWIQDKNEIATGTSLFINERLALIEQELGSVDSDISAFKSKHLITDVRTSSQMYMTQANQAELNQVELNNQIYMANYIKDYLTSSDELRVIPAMSGASSSSVSTQIGKFNDMLIQRNNILANSSMNNPMVQDLDKSLRSLRYAIITAIDNDIVTLQDQLNSQRKYGSKATSQVASNPDQAKYLLDVERQQKVKESIYLFLLQKREENELSQAFTAYNTRVIAPPYGSDHPSAPSKSKILLVALILGLAIPFGILYAEKMLDSTVHNRGDVENKTTIPFLGEIPLSDSKESSRKSILKLKKQKSVPRYNEVKQGSRDLTNEAFRILRTNVEFLMGKGQDKTSNVAVITSYNAGSGKSYISNNLALSLALRNQNVIIVDCDLRKATTSKFYGSPKEGISNYLAGYVDDWKSLVIKNTDHENLSILPVGKLPPNPTELVSDDRFAALIAQLRQDYDYVLLDCPPVEIVADTQIIGQSADRTLFVARAGLFEKTMLKNIESDYKSGKYRNLGLILNGTDYSTRSSYGHRYGYGYGHGYGYGSGYMSKEA